MIRIVTYDLIAQYNLGCPSILHGIRELLQKIYGDQVELINLQMGEVQDLAVSDMGFQTISVDPFGAKDFFKAYFFGKKIKAKRGISLSEAAEIIKSADVVLNLYGICFCEKLTRKTQRSSLLPLYAMLRFPFSAFAKRYHVKSLKAASSFGPAKSPYYKRMAKYCSRFLFDKMVAREEKSLQFLLDSGVSPKKVIHSPDIANLMPVISSVAFAQRTVGISVSHQIVRQWSSAEDYISCVATLCRHICREYGASVLLIPNEFNPNSPYNDVDVAEDCLEQLQGDDLPVEILDVEKLSSSQLKSHIAACEVMVAARYHSCVASLSAGVPLLVIGWHYKYEELLHWYEQDQWLLPENDCDSRKLLQTFDRFWEQREESRKKIQARKPVVEEAVLTAGKQMLGVDS